MAPATDSTVLGDFNKHDVRRNGQVHKFFKRGKGFFVVTERSEGEMEEFKVAYIFGYDPLQNYLVAFDNGKFQTLAWTCDSKKKEWSYMPDAVYPGQDIPPDDWFHWTKMSKNWNGMCADCHSTNLKKGFDPQSKSYRTTWSEINVSCEACHGPVSRHIRWARLPEKPRLKNPDHGLMVETVNIGNRPYVNLCARCHTRRSTLGDYQYEWVDLLDQMIPEFVKTPNYFADGQIKDEDYVFGSFTQSRMYMKKVKCNNCHNVHSGKLIFDGNRLCLQCHLSKDYDTSAHHFHQLDGQSSIEVKDEFGVIQKVGSGAQCINCHMPGRYYMGMDYRRDHSFRIPRPDLSDEYGTPNACT